MKLLMRSFGVALFATCALLGASTATAAKTTTTVIPWFGNQDNKCGDGSATVPAGDVEVRFGWGTYSNLYTTQFLDVQQVTRTVNGVTTTEPVGDKSNWKLTTGRSQTGDKIYLAQYTSPVLATLASGESVTVSLSLKTVGADAYDNDTTVYPEGTELLGTHTTCTITAA